MPELSLNDRILALLRRADYRPMDKVELSKRLNLHSSERRGLVDVLGTLETDGMIARIRKDRYVLPKTADLVTGTLQVHAGGNAHLINEQAGQKDLFISAGNLGVAMNGDKVVARLELGGRGQRREARRGDSAEGRVIRILTRANTTVVGTLKRSKKFFFVLPDDSRLQHDILVQPPKTARIDDKVVVKLEPWESETTAPEGEIIEVLGPKDKQGVDMLSVIRKHQLPMEFPATVLREAERIAETVSDEDMRGREDCRRDFVITIDPDDAKDFDDAILVERTANGWRLAVHIADVSHYVRPGTALDREARVRGNSTYLADRVIPMLPERLSNGVCSLKPRVDRLTTAAFIEFDRAGKIKGARFAKSVIHSAARLTYRQAFAILEKQPVPPTPNYERGGQVHLDAKPVPLDVTPQLRERVETAWELASVLRKKRFTEGSLDLDFPEVKVWLDDQGHAVRVEKVENDISHQLVEECMLAANEVVAREIKHRQTPAVYRIHEDPDPDRLADFREFAGNYGFKAGDMTQRREVQKVLAAIKGTAEEYAIKLQFLKSLMRATYATKPVGHYGLAKVNYTHFTSPIRRYADLLVHRVLARQKVGDVKELGLTAVHLSQTERTSADAEKDSTMLKKMEFFERQLAAKKPVEFRAIVVDVRTMGLFVELPDVMVSGLIHVSALAGDFFQYDSVRLCFIGRKTKKKFALGDKLQVIVARVDAYRRQIDFVPA